MIRSGTYLDIVQDLGTAGSGEVLTHHHHDVLIAPSVFIKFYIRPFKADCHWCESPDTQQQSRHRSRQHFNVCFLFTRSAPLFSVS